MPKKAGRNIIIIAIVLANIALDQVSKVIARQNIERGETIEVLDHYFILTKVENTGAFLSLGSGFSEPMRQALLLILPALVLLGVLFYTFRQRDLPRGIMVGLACIVGGGIGNLYDRTLYGSVTDFMLIDIDIAQTGIFNIADVSIMVGLGLILVNYRHLSRMEKQKKQQLAEANNANEANA